MFYNLLFNLIIGVGHLSILPVLVYLIFFLQQSHWIP